MQARWLSVALLVGRAATLWRAAEPQRTLNHRFENRGSLRRFVIIIFSVDQRTSSLQLLLPRPLLALGMLLSRGPFGFFFGYENLRPLTELQEYVTVTLC